MKFMVIVKATKESEAGIMPDTKLFSDMMKFNEELIKAGVMLSGDGLQPSSKGARVKFTKGKHVVTDGPFIETKELVAGFWIWQCNSLKEAIEWVKKWPPLDGHGEVEIEIRPLYEADDFGPAFTPEERAREERLRAEMAKHQN